MNFTTKKVGALAAAALAVGMASSANAALTYELRVGGVAGGTVEVPATGGSFTVQLVAKITDTAASEGLSLSTTSLFSNPIGGGIANGGGVTAFQLAATGTRNLGQSGGAQNGGNPVAGDLVPSYTNDGVADWGTAENFGASLSTVATTAGSRAKFNRSVTYVATDNAQTSGAFYTIGNEIVMGEYTIAFTAGNLIGSAAGTSARTRFQVDLVRRTSASAPGTTIWMENVVLPTTAVPGATTGRQNSITVAASFGPNGTAQNVGFTEAAFIDFKLAGSTTPTTFLDLVADGSAVGGLTDLGNAIVNGSNGKFIGVELPLAGATKGYVDIITNGVNAGPAPVTVVAFDLVGGALPAGINLNGGVVDAATLAEIQADYGSEYDVAIVYSPDADIAFDFGTVGVTSLVVVPEPTTMGVLALGAIAGLRRRRA